MAKYKTSTETYLPARRRLVRWEGLDSPPELLRPTFSNGPRRQRKKPHLPSLLKALPLIFVAIAILVGAKWLVDYSFTPSFRGVLPEFYPQVSTTLELPSFGEMGSVSAVRKLQKNDNIEALARNYGLGDDTAADLKKAIEAAQAKSEGKTILQPGRMLEFEFDQSGKLQGIQTEPEPGKLFSLTRSPAGAFAVQMDTVPADHGERVAVGIIESSFAAAAMKAGVRYDIVDDLVDLFSNRVEFRKDFHRGDRFTVIYRDILLSDGRPAGGSQILAAALEVNGEHLVAARYIGTDGKIRFFDEKGQLLGNTFLRYPLKFSRISSLFTQSRFHPVLKFNRPHNGVDFAAPTGTPVRSVAEGVVEMAGRSGGSGIMIKIRHNERYSTAYLHLSAISKSVTRGARVRRGDVIGAVGMTGLATGPHLHFSFYDHGKYVDPLSIKLPTLDFLDAASKMDTSYLKRVLFTLDHYQTVDLTHFYND